LIDKLTRLIPFSVEGASVFSRIRTLTHAENADFSLYQRKSAFICVQI